MEIAAVRKRDGKLERWDRDRIAAAIEHAYRAVRPQEEPPALTVSMLALQAERRIAGLAASRGEDNPPQIEEIQDVVEDVLIEARETAVAKAYILYRARHQAIRDTKALMLDIDKTMDGYLQMSDWRVQENANVNFSLGGLILHNSGSITANYWLKNVYPERVARAHREADMHIHDLSMFSGYCAGWSLRQLIEEGLGGVAGKITSKPAKHLNTLAQQMVNFLGIMQNEWAGAQAFSSFDTYLAPFVREDGLELAGVKQALQAFVFGVNTPSRWGSQAPFTNITLDWVPPNDLKDRPALHSGREMDYTYGDLQAEMDLVNRAFLEVMIEGDANGRGFQYPIPTYNVTREFAWDSPNAELLFKMTAKYGTPYFQNFVNSDLNPGDVRSMCCRLQLDKRELRKRGGGLFGSDEFTGSIGVVTINMPRIAYLSRSEDEFFTRLDELMDIAAESLTIKRKMIARLMNNGLFPYTKRYLQHLNNHFNTIGICGMNEASLNLGGPDMSDPDARQFALRVLNHMRDRLSEYQEASGELFNLEATPAESTSYRLALHDRRRFADIITSGDEDPFYTNSSQLPVDATRDIFDALDAQDELQTRYTGGTVFHGFLGEAIEDWRTARELVKTIAWNYRLPYFTISPTFSVCAKHGYLTGEHHFCPHCREEGRESAPPEIYSRIVGYYRSLVNWNHGKREEFTTRTTYAGWEQSIAPEDREHPVTAIASTAPETADKSTAMPEIIAPGSGTEALRVTYFYQERCANCGAMGRALETAVADPCCLEVQRIDVAAPQGFEQAAAAGITATPTLIVHDAAGAELWRTSDPREAQALLIDSATGAGVSHSAT